MKQISLYRRRLLPGKPIAGSLLLMALIGPGIAVAQIALCPEKTRLGANIDKEPCSNPLIPFNLPESSGQSDRPHGNSLTVSIHQLNHVVPKKAIKEEEIAQKAFGQNRTQEAISHLENAVRIDPEFIGARNDLAAIHLRMDDPYPAIDQLNEAIKVDPHFPLLFINLAIGYIETGALSDAERAAREAADLDRARILPQYLLAVSLYYEKKFTEEALQCAKRTSDDYPASHLFAARILIERSDYEPAKVEIQAYLSDNRQAPEFAATAKSWLAFMARHEQKRSAVAP